MSRIGNKIEQGRRAARKIIRGHQKFLKTLAAEGARWEG